jgi:hypothetical protein
MSSQVSQEISETDIKTKLDTLFNHSRPLQKAAAKSESEIIERMTKKLRGLSSTELFKRLKNETQINIINHRRVILPSFEFFRRKKISYASFFLSSVLQNMKKHCFKGFFIVNGRPSMKC